MDELSVFNKKETQFLVLLATGGYGFWILQGLALRSLDPESARLVFYTAPLLMALMAAFSSEKAAGKLVGSLLMGFVGCIMIMAVPTEHVQAAGGAGWTGYIAAGGWAACLALFSVVARRTVDDEQVMPVLTIVLAGGAVCVLVSCVAARVNVFALSGRQLIACAFAGGILGTAVFGFWTAALSRASLAKCAPFWYLTPVCGAVIRIWQEGSLPGWWSIGGIVLIVLALRTSMSVSREASKTLGDILRGD
jgi:drug/metabolite transporter (DMT)-like permease